MASPYLPERTLISFVGTGDYSETVYRWNGIGDCKTGYIAAAQAALWKPAAIVLLATQAAEDKHGESLLQTLAAAGNLRFGI